MSGVLPVALTAHESLRVVGKFVRLVRQAPDEYIEIRTAQGKKVLVPVRSETPITRGGKPLAPRELKPGQSLVAEGFGDSIDTMAVSEIRVSQSGGSK